MMELKIKKSEILDIYSVYKSIPEKTKSILPNYARGVRFTFTKSKNKLYARIFDGQQLFTYEIVPLETKLYKSNSEDDKISFSILQDEFFDVIKFIDAENINLCLTNDGRYIEIKDDDGKLLYKFLNILFSIPDEAQLYKDFMTPFVSNKGREVCRIKTSFEEITKIYERTMPFIDLKHHSNICKGLCVFSWSEKIWFLSTDTFRMSIIFYETYDNRVKYDFKEDFFAVLPNKFVDCIVKTKIDDDEEIELVIYENLAEFTATNINIKTQYYKMSKPSSIEKFIDYISKVNNNLYIYFLEIFTDKLKDNFRILSKLNFLKASIEFIDNNTALYITAQNELEDSKAEQIIRLDKKEEHIEIENTQNPITSVNISQMYEFLKTVNSEKLLIYGAEQLKPPNIHLIVMRPLTETNYYHIKACMAS
jgi:hypothetical protein